jgi:hypothetical protein
LTSKPAVDCKNFAAATDPSREIPGFVDNLRLAFRRLEAPKEWHYGSAQINKVTDCVVRGRLVIAGLV